MKSCDIFVPQEVLQDDKQASEMRDFPRVKTIFMQIRQAGLCKYFSLLFWVRYDADFRVEDMQICGNWQRVERAWVPKIVFFFFNKLS